MATLMSDKVCSLARANSYMYHTKILSFTHTHTHTLSLPLSLKRFHEAAYSAMTNYDLMDAIDEFLDGTIVLPPGDWDQNLLLPIMHERNELRRRKGGLLLS